MSKTLSWGTPPPQVVKQSRIIQPAPTVELRTGPDQIIDAFAEGDVTLRRRDGGPLSGTTTQPLIDGVATFDDLVIPELGLHELVAQVDTERLEYPGLPVENAVLLFRFDEPPGSPETHAEVGGVTLPMPSNCELIGKGVRRTGSGQNALQGSVAGVAGLSDLVNEGEGVLRIWHRLGGAGHASTPVLIGVVTAASNYSSAIAGFFRGVGTEEAGYRYRAAGGPTAFDAVGPRGEPHLLSIHWKRTGSNTAEINVYADGHLVRQVGSVTGTHTPANYLHLLRTSNSSAYIGTDLFEFGIFAGPTTPEKEMQMALRCGVVR